MSYESEQKWLKQLVQECLPESEELQADDKSDDEEQDHIETRSDTESEQDLDEELYDEGENEATQQEEASTSEADHLYYIGKDKITKWRQHCEPSSLRSRTKAKNIVTQLPGVKQSSKNLVDPVEICRKFFDASVLNIIVKHTNTHIASFALGKYSRETYTKRTDVIEIEALIGLLYLCGVKKLNRLCCEEIFATDGSSTELFRLTMSM